MPIYEFYCPECHMIFSFLSRTVNTAGRPSCPRCRKRRLQRQVALFSALGGIEEKDEPADIPIDESRMESAMTRLAGEAEKINEDDPRQAARLMRRFSSATGMEFGQGMQEALSRMEAGEDPEKVEAEMGDLMNEEEPFVLPGKTGVRPGSGSEHGGRSGEPRRDPKLYEM